MCSSAAQAVAEAVAGSLAMSESSHSLDPAPCESCTFFSLLILLFSLSELCLPNMASIFAATSAGICVFLQLAKGQLQARVSGAGE